MQQKFEFKTTTVDHAIARSTGQVHISGKWLAGCIRDGDTLTLARTGQEIVVNSVHVGTGPLEIVLRCGHVQPVLKELKEGDLILGSH
jgi:hypothetical protein